jgi:phosphoribosylglycinamide formyltransferase-1
VDYRTILRSRTSVAPENATPIDFEEIDGAQKILKISDSPARIDRLKRLISAEHQMIGLLDRYDPDLICLAGFMRLISPYFIRHFNRAGTWRILNIHPALLPAFPGQHGYEDTFSYGCRWGGVTVHFVDEGEDTGPIIAQAIYPIWPNDSIDRVRERGLSLEYEVYAQCINWIAGGRIHLHNQGHRFFARIDDPAYPEIVRAWTHQALDTPP